MTPEQLTKIRDILVSAQNFIYNDMDAMCDSEYQEEAQAIVEQIDRAVSMIDGELQ